jgi:undecaprenyl-diphosphatase
MLGELFAGELLVNYFLQSFIPTLTPFFQIISFFGHPALWILIGAWLFWLGKEKKSFFLVSLVTLTVLFSGLLKFIIARPRPEGLIILESTPTNLSMPSGHSVLAGTIYGFFEKKVFPKERIFLLIIVLLTGISRLYLGVHYLSDVFLGLIIGYFFGKLLLKLEKKVKKAELKITKFNEEKELFILFVITIILLILLPETLLLGFAVLGYYFGFVIYRHKKMKMKSSWISFVIGNIILILLAFFAFITEGLLSISLFFLSGLFITLLWPFITNSFQKKQILKILSRRSTQR